MPERGRPERGAGVGAAGRSGPAPQPGDRHDDRTRAGRTVLRQSPAAGQHVHKGSTRDDHDRRGYARRPPVRRGPSGPTPTAPDDTSTPTPPASARIAERPGADSSPCSPAGAPSEHEVSLASGEHGARRAVAAGHEAYGSRSGATAPGGATGEPAERDPRGGAAGRRCRLPRAPRAVRRGRHGAGAARDPRRAPTWAPAWRHRRCAWTRCCSSS